MSNLFEVLNPWADAEPIPLEGISPRLTELSGKTIGLFAGHKMASRPVLTSVQKGLRQRFPSAKFSLYLYNENIDVTESKEKDQFKEWVNSVDTVVSAVGD